MTTLELIAFLEHLQKKGLLNNIHIEPSDYEKTVLDFQKQQNKPEWTDKFFPPTTPEK